MIGHRMTSGNELAPLRTDARILLDEQGLAGSREAARILLARAEAKAEVPRETGVLVVAHGLGAEEANRELLSAMEKTSSLLRSRGYADVRVVTLREDWPEARAAAERTMRMEVIRMNEAHSEVLVIPLRVFGFGPYATVLEGLEYTAAEGLLPHPLVTEWIAGRVKAQSCAAGLPSAFGPCDAIAHPGDGSAGKPPRS